MAIEIPSIVRISQVPEVAIDIDWLACPLAPEGRVLTLTTMGLRGLGQKELLLALRQHDQSHIDTALNLFQMLLEQARDGQWVDVNGLTELGPDGIFGHPRIGGIAYGRSHSVDPLVEKLGASIQLQYPQLLSMTLLSRNEVAVMKSFGFARVQSRICAQQRYFPYPFWNDLEREDAITIAECEHSVALQLQFLPSVFATLQNQTVQVYFQSSIKDRLQAGYATHPAAAFVTEIAPNTGDGLLVWFADKPGIVVNTPRLFAVDENAAALDSIDKLAGCSIVICHDTQASQGGIVAEDGFWVSLNDDGWQSFREALINHETCFVEGRDGCFDFSLNWIG